jgi:hypothetical protein
MTDLAVFLILAALVSWIIFDDDGSPKNSEEDFDWTEDTDFCRFVSVGNRLQRVECSDGVTCYLWNDSLACFASSTKSDLEAIK